MKIGKSMESMVKRVTGQVGKRLDEIDLESMLASIGLQVFKQRRSLAWPLISAFGAGVAVGMIFAPMSGKDLRGRIVSLARRATKSDPRELTSDGRPVASPYDDAKERDERLNAANRASRRGPVQAIDPGTHLSSPT